MHAEKSNATNFYKRSRKFLVEAASERPSTNDADGVRVVPRKPLPGAVRKFQVAMDTRTKQLNDDLTKTAALVDDGGRRYLPLSWQGDPPGGHHRKGVLQFAVPKNPSNRLNCRSRDWAEQARECFDGT
jgi:hypothetical protein